MAQLNEKWILTVKELHLGHCKDTFHAGAVIEFDEMRGMLIIDGRKFNDTRDLDVLKRQALVHPEAPWIIPYSPEARAEIVQSIPNRSVGQTPAARILPGQHMRVIKSDQDLNEEIDIRDTQISKVHEAEKQAVRMKVQTNGMEIIRGDETVAERLASLKGKTDLNSIAERTGLKLTGAARMAIVRDDSLGAGYSGKSTISMNAGQHFPSRAEIESKQEESKALAESRKQELEMTRKAATGAGDEESGISVPPELEEAPVSVKDDLEPARISQAGIDAPRSASVKTAVQSSESCEPSENDKLRSENDALKERMDRLEKMLIAQSGVSSKRGKKIVSEPAIETVKE